MTYDMSGNPYQEDRGNKDASITNPKGGRTLVASPGTGQAMDTASAFLIGDTMTGGYGAGPDILHDCTIAVSPGEIAVIVGPNGAGKSTAMKAEFGMLNVRQGSVRLDGEDITDLSPQDRVVKGMGWRDVVNALLTAGRTTAPIMFLLVTAQMYSDTDITMGYVSTDEAITHAAELPTIAVVAPLEINPQIIMWDPETNPEVQSIADLKDVEGGPAIIRYFGTATYMPDLVGRGVVVEEQLDGSYDGSPAVFVAEGGAIAQQGFASAEPYIYENEVDEWGKPVAFELIHDVGLQAYAASMALRPETFDELSASGCLAALVPMMQQAQIDFIEDPSNTIPLILELVEAYDNGWQYSQGVAEFSVDTQLELGLVGNGPDDILGNFDLDRAQGVIDTLNEIADEVGFDIPADLAPEAFLTNEFIAESIGLG